MATAAAETRRPFWRLWMTALVALALLAAGAWRITSTSRPPAIPASDLYTVRYGTVRQTVSAAGTIAASRAIDLSFLVQGRVASVDVRVGQFVRQGQVLARLAASTYQDQVLAAEAGVALAKANLAKLYQTVTPQQVAEAQAKVAQAEATLAGARQALRDAESAYTDPSQREAVVAAENQVSQAAAALKVAQANVAAAQVGLREAETGVATSAANTLPATIQADTTALDEAQAQLAVDQKTLANAEATLRQDEQRLKVDEATYGSVAQQYAADQAAYQKALKEFQNGQAYPVNPYAALLQETEAIAAEASTAYNTIENDQHTVLADQASVEAAQRAVHADTAAVQGDKATLAAAQNQLASVEGQNPLTVQQAQAAVQQAETGLSEAEATYAAAERSLTLAEEVYRSRIAARSSVDAARANVAEAQAGVTEAKTALAALLAPPTSADVAAAKAAVRSAEAQLALAQATASHTVLRAPVNGMVVAVNGAPGSDPPTSEPMIVLDGSDMADLTVDFAVSEAQRARIAPGDPLSVASPAVPGRTFTGTVAYVYPEPQVISDVPAYTIAGVVRNVGDLLTPGMSVTVTVETALARHVLVVPRSALQQVGGRSGVYVWRPVRTPARPPSLFDRTAQPGSALPPGVRFQPVTTGLQGDADVAVLSGLKPGERVLLALPQS